MVVDALLEADTYLDISSRIYDPARFTYLSDDILLEVERSTVPVNYQHLFSEQLTIH